ncbi:tissue alpha-L-fucosidase-like [Dermacentor albipictus]|uniref:tissue alpha-L-fucosidase-like n=1 Tax=Dermacentor albipictus TaxID=60249 RepID=UPI0031FC2A46
MSLSTACLLILIVCWALAGFSSAGRYSPDWPSLDTRPLPSWFDEAKIGVFIHWGVYSVPGFGSEWFWWNWREGDPAHEEFMRRYYRPDFKYQDFAPQFRAEFFDPDRWADIFARSGARYVVLTSKHHDGFTLWPSNVSWNWNAQDVGPHRDLVGDVADAVRRRGGMRFGLYHSLMDWFHPLFQADNATGFSTASFPPAKTLPELLEIVNRYRPDIVWSDGDWLAPDTYWNSTSFLAWLYNDSPVRSTVVVNDRWGKGVSCKHGDFFNCEDRFNPGVLQPHKWENCLSLDKYSWGYRHHATLSDYHTIHEILDILASTISCNGNLLVNVGPTKEGVILPVFEERLTQLGKWLAVNGEAVYGSKPWKHQNDTATPHVWYTAKSNVLYVYVMRWPKNEQLVLDSLEMSPYGSITMLGLAAKHRFTWRAADLVGDGASKRTHKRGTIVTFPKLTADKLPTPWAWVLKVQGAR